MDAFLRMMMGQPLARGSRQEILARHRQSLEQWEDTDTNDTIHFLTSHGPTSRGGVSRTKNISLNPRNRISIKDLKIDNVHTGRFLLCRVIEKCIKLVALATIVEDPEGDVERIALYNWAPQSTGLMSIDKATSYLPVGTFLAVKNPYYKIAGDALTMIRSDNPAEIEIIGRDSELLKDIKWSDDNSQSKQRLYTANDFQKRGNENFTAKDYKPAIDEYSHGLELEPNNVTLLVSRAESYLKLRLFAKAFDDSEIILEHEKNHQKAKFCKGKALCGLKRYQEAITIFQELLETGNTRDRKSFEDAVKHAQMLEHESKGHYDYLSIIKEFKEKVQTQSDGKWICTDGPRLDHADYISDDIEVRHIGNKGRGWVAKKDIPAHTLLIVSKAFHIVYENEVPFGLSGDWVNGCFNSQTQTELISCLAQKIAADPNLGKELYQLYAGPNSPSGKKLEDQEALSVDIDRIENIVKYNVFNPDDIWNLSKNKVETTEKSVKSSKGTGLWILPSYFNHTCLDCNVLRIFLGDLMFVRPVRPIKKGEELTFSYVDPVSSGEKRLKSLKSFGITCNCRLCKIDRAESQQVIQKRNKLNERFENSIRPKTSKLLNGYLADTSLIQELEQLVTDFHDLRKSHPNLNFHIMDVKSALALAYATIGESRKSLHMMHELYDLVRPYNLYHYSNQCAVHIANRNFELGQLQKTKKWHNNALRQLVEPVRGQFKDNETNWKEEALLFAKILEPELWSN